MKKFRILIEKLDSSGKQYNTKEKHKYFPNKETAVKYCEWQARKNKGVRYKVNGEVK